MWEVRRREGRGGNLVRNGARKRSSGYARKAPNVVKVDILTALTRADPAVFWMRTIARLARAGSRGELSLVRQGAQAEA